MAPTARRRFLAAASLAGLASRRWWPEQGVYNPCLGPLPPELADHPLVREAWVGLDPAAIAPLTAIRRHNPLLFDFVLKRRLRIGGLGLSSVVFETRRFFARNAVALEAFKGQRV